MSNPKCKNIKDIKNCYGCGVCAISCPKRLIDLKINTSGFWEPELGEEDKCTHCGLCSENCAFNHLKLAVQNIPIVAYAAWSKDEYTRNICSSGGVVYEVCKYYIKYGYKICGVKYDSTNNIVIHEICSDVDDLVYFSGSKYLQSYTLNGFKQINKTDKYVVIGTPCQIDSFRRYIKQRNIEENFILVDFFCHGVPSIRLWQKFAFSLRKQVGNFKKVTWRNKIDGWHKSYRLDIIGENGEYHHTGLKFDYFFNLYFSNAALSPSCFDRCKYKQDRSSADIRVGDMWGEAYKNEVKGVNSVICFTEKGIDAITKSECTIKRVALEDVLTGQMIDLPHRDIFFKKLNPLIVAEKDNWREITSTFRRMFFIKRIIYKVKFILMRIK